MYYVMTMYVATLNGFSTVFECCPSHFSRAVHNVRRQGNHSVPAWPLKPGDPTAPHRCLWRSSCPLLLAPSQPCPESTFARAPHDAISDLRACVARGSSGQHMRNEERGEGCLLGEFSEVGVPASPSGTHHKLAAIFHRSLSHDFQWLRFALCS